MPRRPARLPQDPNRPYAQIVHDFKGGTMTLLRENRAPANTVVESLNARQVQDSVWAPKYGADYYSVSTPSFRKGSPTVTTNLLTNPSFETNTTGWSGVSSATIATDATQYYVGTKSLKITKTGSTSQGVLSADTANVAASTYHTGSLYIKAPVGVSMTLTLLHNAIVVATTVVVGTGVWQRATASGASGLGSHGMALKLMWSTSDSVYIDACMIEAATDASDYFDGATTDTDSTDYAWTGAANASTSTKSVYVYEPYDLDGAFDAVKTDKSTVTLEVAGGKLYRSIDGGTKTEVTISPGTLTAGHECFFLQIHDYVYIGNNYDPVVRYDTVLQTAASYTALATPIAATGALTGLAAGSLKACYVIVASNSVGTTVGSPELVMSIDKPRDEWATSTTAVNTTNFVTLTLTRVTNASRYSIFYSDQSGFEVYLDSVPDPGSGTTFTYVDRGQIAPNDFVELPNDNTTGGPKLGQMCLSSNRIFALDGDNAYRVNWAGVGRYTGYFSPYYGGGYVDLEKGGREWPTFVTPYRDGKGTAMVTAFTNDPENRGSTWQITLDTVTVGSTSFLVPNPVKIVGSLGAAGSRAACKAGDDVVMGNGRGAFSLGSAPSIVNVLATRELSANVRTNWRDDLDGAGLSGMALYEYDAKIFFAVPANASTNSEIWVRDREKSNWQLAWTGVAVKSFFESVDSTGHVHLLAVPVAGSRLIELSPDIAGDFGEAFTTRIKTPRLPVDRNHNKFVKLENLFVEVGSPRGEISVDFYGYDYRKGFIFLKNITINGGSASTVDWGDQWSTQEWSYIGDLPTFVTDSIERRYKKCTKLVNDLQYVITCDNIGDYFELLEFGAEGTVANVAPPRIWKDGVVPESVPAEAITDETGQPILI